MQIEENSGAEKPKADETPQQPVEELKPEKPAKFKKMPVSKFQSIVNTVTLVLASLVIGALAILLALYLPALNKLNKAQVEAVRLANIETQYTELQANYSKVKEQAGVYKTISDTNLLEAALASNDTTKANQQLRYVEEDLKAMQIVNFPEILQRLQSQFLMVKSNAVGNPQKAMEELGKFYTDLLMLADNLK
jgi:hypothetical protein